MSSNLFSQEPKQVIEGFYELRQAVLNLEERRAEAGKVPGYRHREFGAPGLPSAKNSFKDPQRVKCVEYLAHAEQEELPRQVRLGYRPSNGYSESVTYRDQYWTKNGEVCYAIEFSANKNGMLKRSATYARNGEVLHSDVTHVQLKSGRRFS